MLRVLMLSMLIGVMGMPVNVNAAGSIHDLKVAEKQDPNFDQRRISGWWFTGNLESTYRITILNGNIPHKGRIQVLTSNQDTLFPAKRIRDDRSQESNMQAHWETCISPIEDGDFISGHEHADGFFIVVWEPLGTGTPVDVPWEPEGAPQIDVTNHRWAIMRFKSPVNNERLVVRLDAPY